MRRERGPNQNSGQEIAMPKKLTINKTRTKKHIVHHKDGSIWAKGKMVGKQPDGYWEWFRKEGSIMRSGYFKKGKQAGEWTTYDKAGAVVKVTNFDKKKP
jgi:antitoxin component YwqK of YwqJK toxin-antitoxin module